MSRKQYSLSKQLMVAAALALGASGVALADDSSMSLFHGDSYAYFNGGQVFPNGKPVLDYAPSTYRPTPPQDPLTFQQQHFPFKLAVDNAPSTYRATPPKDALTYEQTHFPYANLGVSDAPSTNRPSYPEDALTYKQTHFPFATLSVSDASASSKSPAR